MQLINRNFKISRGRAEILLSKYLSKKLLGIILFNVKDSSKKELIKIFKESDFTEAYIVDLNQNLIGKVKVNDLLKDIRSSEFIDQYPLTLRSNETVSEGIAKASNFVGESIPVVDDNNKLIGVVTEADLFSEYLQVQQKISLIEKGLV